MSHRPHLALLVVFPSLLGGCEQDAPDSPGDQVAPVVDMRHARDLGRPVDRRMTEAFVSADLTVWPPDMPSEMAVPGDLSLLDLAEPPEIAIPRDQAMSDDFPGPRDLAVVRDLAARDLAVRDLSVRDLSAPRDLVPADLIFDPMAPVTGLSGRHWRITFADEFRGKPDSSARSNYCYDQLKPQCQIWAGSQSHDCDAPYDVAGDPPQRGYYEPLRENMAAAISTFDTSQQWSTQSWPVVQARYSSLLKERTKDLDKCAWTSHEQLNWWGTDYKGSWSTKHDASRVTVDKAGKGYLKLTAAKAPVQVNCVFGGTPSGPNNVNCAVKGFAAGVLVKGVSYWVDADPRWPGVYYAGVGGKCPYGGTGGSPNCTIQSLTTAEVEVGVSYWVDTDPRWPGIYYANNTAYRCKENVEYPGGGVLFRKLTCPLMTGAIISADSPPVGTSTLRRGFQQKRGRFEAKLRIPKGQGSFPAAWILGSNGGWPYSGGEIDLVEARDAANEIYQTYHHGRCFSSDWSTEQLRDPTNALLPIGNGECQKISGYRSIQLSKGVTIAERTYNHGPKPSNEFWTRDHVFSAEWDESEIRFYTNNVKTSTVAVGTVSTGQALLGGPALPSSGIPAAAKTYRPHTLPAYAMYWILNQSVYVPLSSVAGFQPQELRIDYVRTYRDCVTHIDFCPCGGQFTEGVGCRLPAGGKLSCPADVTPPSLQKDVYASSCQKPQMECVAGGIPYGPNCQVHAFGPGVLVQGVSYWADSDPRWPGVFYAAVGGKCPYGGSGGSPNCQILAFPADALEAGVTYWVDTDPRWPGVYYEPDFRN